MKWRAKVDVYHVAESSCIRERTLTFFGPSSRIASELSFVTGSFSKSLSFVVFD